MEQFIDEAMPYGTPSTNIVLSSNKKRSLLLSLMKIRISKFGVYPDLYLKIQKANLIIVSTVYRVERGEMLLEIKELEEIMQQHTERLIRLAFYYVKDLQSAEDIVQDVFIKFYDNQQNYEERGELRAYLSRLVINKSKDYLRSWTYRKIQVQQKIFAKQTITKRDMLVQQDEQTLVENAILALPLKQREVLIYFYFEEMPVINIAELLCIPESTVKTRLRRGRELLRPKLQHIEWEVLLHE